MKTAREWFETFPEPYRSKAIQRLFCDDLSPLTPTIYGCASDAVADAILWHENFRFWSSFYDKLVSQNQ